MSAAYRQPTKETMTKQATSIRLSDEAEQNIKTIRERYAYLADKTAAIEFAVWVVAHSNESLPRPVPAAARPPAAPDEPNGARSATRRREKRQ